MARGPGAEAVGGFGGGDGDGSRSAEGIASLRNLRIGFVFSGRSGGDE